MCLLGAGELDDATRAQNEFTWTVAMHQKAEGLGCSVENPKGSKLFQETKYVRDFGTLGTPKPGWSFYRLEGCQFKVIYPGNDDPGRPIQKALVWLANYDLSCLESRCRKPAALVGTSHEHRHARGGMHVECEGWKSVAAYTGKYTAELGTVFAKACHAFVAETSRRSERVDTRLKTLADKSLVAKEQGAPISICHGTPQFALQSDDKCVDLIGDSHRRSPLLLREPSLEPAASGGAKGSLRKLKPKLELRTKFMKIT